MRNQAFNHNATINERLDTIEYIINKNTGIVCALIGIAILACSSNKPTVKYIC